MKSKEHIEKQIFLFQLDLNELHEIIVDLKNEDDGINQKEHEGLLMDIANINSKIEILTWVLN